LLVSVPATIITSDCRGEARGAKPKRSASYRGIDTCIISTAQHARPNVIHINDPVRAQGDQVVGGGDEEALVGQFVIDFAEERVIGADRPSGGGIENPGRTRSDRGLQVLALR